MNLVNSIYGWVRDNDQQNVSDVYETMQQKSEELRKTARERERMTKLIDSLTKRNKEHRRKEKSLQSVIGQGEQYVSKLEDWLRSADDEIHSKDYKLNVAQSAVQRERQDHEGTMEAYQHLTADNLILLDQINHFKKDIASMTKIGEDIGDDEISEQLGNIFASIQHFVVQNFRSSELDVTRCGIQAQSWLHRVAPATEKLPRALRNKLLTGIFAKIMTHQAGAQHYFGTCTSLPVEAACHLAKGLKNNGALETKTWLEMTEKLIEAQSPGTLEQARTALATNMANQFYVALVEAVSVKWTKIMFEDLTRIFEDALLLFRMMHRQRSTFEVVQVRPVWSDGTTQTFTNSFHEDLTYADDEQSLEGCSIAISVFPGILKVTDDKGQKLDPALVIAKARVVPNMPEEHNTVAA